MKIIKKLENKVNFVRPVIAIGNFDGVHIGHKKILALVIQKAKEIKGTPIVVTFCPHPEKVLFPDRDLKFITTFKDKSKMLEQLGIEVIICIRFNKKIMSIEPDSFIKDILVKFIKPCWIIVGYNYTYGKARGGNPETLKQSGLTYGFKVTIARYAKVDKKIVSSSLIRNLILEGNISMVSKMLGRAYHIDGIVIKGNGRGARKINVATANIKPSTQLIPPNGVYATKVLSGDTIYDSISNIGNNPTFSNKNISYETHIFNFEKNIIGRKLKVYFIARIRDEKKFENIESLRQQIQKDIQNAKKILALSPL